LLLRKLIPYCSPVYLLAVLALYISSRSILTEESA
jgi:hypothetical protein